jgi:hypothetical protein
MNLSKRWFRLLLRLYPSDFRDEMGEALVETYLERSREEPLAAVWFIALGDSLRKRSRRAHAARCVMETQR